MKEEPIHLLLVEDDPDDVLLLHDMLAETPHPPFNTVHVDRLGHAAARLSSENFDVILLDLSLPDSDGLGTLKALYETGAAPIVVLTGTDDEDTAIQAVQSGAQDYLVKGNIGNDLLLRSVRYAIERFRLKTRLEEMRQQEQRERELQSLERLSPVRISVTSRAYGQLPIREVYPDIFQEMVQRYSELLDESLARQVFKTGKSISDVTRSIGDDLGRLKAKPRDIVDIHTAALQEKTKTATLKKGQAYLEEARLRLIEMMGYLADFYRNIALGSSVPDNVRQDTQKR